MDAIKKDLPKEEECKGNSKKEDLPGQQLGVYSEATDEEVQEVVEEMNAEVDSLGYRG